MAVAVVDVRVDSSSAVRNLQQINAASKTTQAGINGLTAVVGRLGIALSAIGTARFIFAKTAELETQTRSIQVLTGSVEQAKQIISELQQLGAVTPFTSTELIDAAKRLQAFGVEAKNVVDTTRRLADVAGATGAELQGLVTAYGQVQAKGRLQGEELLQFQERGIALQGELRKMYGMTGDEFQKALSKGQISAQAVEVAIKRLTDAGGKYADGAIAQSDTLNGKFSTLMDQVDALARSLGTMLSPVLSKLITDVTNMVNSFIVGLNRIQTAYNNFYQNLKGKTPNELQGQIDQINAWIAANQKQLKTAGGGTETMLQNKIKELRALRATLQKDLDKSLGLAGPAGQPPLMQQPQSNAAPPALLAPAGAGAGGTAKAKPKATDKSAAIAASQLQLSQAQALYNVEGRILEARASGNRQLEIARQAQEDLLRINYEAQRIRQDKEMPAAQKTAELKKLEVDAARTSRRMAFDILTYEQERLTAAAGAMQQLQDELDLQQAKINGNEAEVILNQQIRDLKAQYPALNEADIRTTLQKTNALKQQISAAEQLKQLYADVGMSIKSGVVDAIQGAIDGTKSLQQVASDLLSSIANKLLDVAINMALFGTMSGTGTGGGLLGGLFRANGGIPQFANGGSIKANQLSLVGERGPELFMPGRSGTIIPNHNLGGGAINVTVNVDASGSSVTGDQAQGKQLALAVSAAVQAELIKQKRPGGMLS